MKSWTLTLTASAIFASHHAVTVDRHIAHMLFGVSRRTAKHHDQAEALFRELAAKFGWKPQEVQADPWVAWNAQGLRNTQLEQGKNAKVLEDYFASAGGAFERGCEHTRPSSSSRSRSRSPSRTVRRSSSGGQRPFPGGV